MSGISNDILISAAGRRQTENEDYKLLAIFPAEIWMAILSLIDDPADMYNMARASPLLERFLEHQKLMYFFYMVLKICDNCGDNMAPNLCDYLGNTSELLKCRLVCTGWKGAVNRFLESRLHHFTVSCGPSSSTIAYIPQAYLKDVAYPARFRLEDISVHKNQQKSLLLEMTSYQDKLQNDCPSPTRHLEITDDKLYAHFCRSHDEHRCGSRGMLRERSETQRRRDRLHRYRNFAKMFLEKVGHTFHHLTIQMNSYKLVGEYFEQTPNLRSLCILAGNNEEHAVTQSLLDMCFPNLKNLKLVSLYRIPHQVAKMVLDANPDAKVVELFRHGAINPRVQANTETGSCGPVWPVNPVNFTTTITSVEELLGMSIYRNLKVLKLNFTEGVFIKWSSIFRKVECYQDTLTELHLEMPPYQHDGLPAETLREIWNDSQTPLKLQVLKRLEIKVETECSLDFLLGLPFLEHLHLTLGNYVASQDGSGLYYDDNVNTERTDFNRGFSEHFMECNIWELMPSLKEVYLKLGDRPVRKYRGKFRNGGCNMLRKA